MKILESLNKLTKDEFGRISGTLAMDKQPGISAHDLVDLVRKKLATRKVGHAGALDGFATGLMLILVGKNTKLSDQLLNMDKTYKAKVLLGISTETQDIEGSIKEIDTTTSLTQSQFQEVILGFVGEQKQFVSLYSSVKVDGKKLRVVMRDEAYKKETELDNEGNKFILLNPVDESKRQIKLKVPCKNITIADINVLSFQAVDTASVMKYFPLLKNISADNRFYFADIEVSCSKGTYIRQLAEDIGSALGVPACLVELRRTRIGEVLIEQAIGIDQLTI